MAAYPNGPEAAERVRTQSFQAMELAINWQQQALKAGLVSSEMMRIGMHHLQRHFDYLNMLSESLNEVSRVNADFLQRITEESASDWSKTAAMAANWTRETAEQTSQNARQH